MAIDPAPSGRPAAADLGAEVLLAVLGNPANRNRAVPLTYEQFRFGFANAVSEDEAKELYETYAVPASGAPLFQAATANLNPWTEAKVDSKNPERGPLLIISGEKDNTVPWAIANASYKKQRRNEGVTEIVEIPDRGHALTIDSGWREVADTALRLRQALRLASWDGGGSATISAQERPLLAAAREGDEEAFRRLVEPYRGELHAHAYRMLGSVHDAEDALQEALLRAWRGLARFEGRSSLRSWLYTIATNTSLNAIARRPKRVLPIDYAPGRRPARRARPAGGRIGVDGALRRRARSASQDGLAGPEARYEQRESVELAFVAALQYLPPNQRAVLILRDVLGFSAEETAETLETTVASVNSALQRARASVEDRLPDQSQQATLRALGDERLNEIVDELHAGVGALRRRRRRAMLTEDACFAMPPLATWFGRARRIETFLVGSPMSGAWRWKSVRVRANGQAALAFYSWDDDERDLPPVRAQRPHLPRAADQRRDGVHRPHPAAGRRPRGHRADARAAGQRAQPAWPRSRTSAFPSPGLTRGAPAARAAPRQPPPASSRSGPKLATVPRRA